MEKIDATDEPEFRMFYDLENGKLKNAWIAAHIIMVIRYEPNINRPLDAMENIVLLRVDSFEEALVKAKAHGLKNEIIGGDFTWKGHRANLHFAGVRTFMMCGDGFEAPHHGMEATYKTITVDSWEQVQQLVADETVPITYQGCGMETE